MNFTHSISILTLLIFQVILAKWEFSLAVERAPDDVHDHDLEAELSFRNATSDAHSSSHIEVAARTAGVNNATNTDPSTVKIIDVTMYNGEPIALLRYYYLKDVVDYFFIVESLESFSGQFKAGYEIDKYTQYLEPLKPKLVILKLDHLEAPATFQNESAVRGLDCPICWAKEEYQRNVLYDKIMSVMGKEQRFIALICDVDELPKQDLVRQLNTMYGGLHGGAYMHMEMLMYNFRWRMVRKVAWRKAFVLTDQIFRNSTTGGSFMEQFRKRAHHRTSIDILGAAGWHMSYFMTIEQIQGKLKQFSHQEYNVATITSTEHIRKCINKGMYLFNSKFAIVPYEGVLGFPWPCEGCADLPYFEIFKFPTFTDLQMTALNGSNSFDRKSQWFRRSLFLGKYKKRINTGDGDKTHRSKAATAKVPDSQGFSRRTYREHSLVGLNAQQLRKREQRQPGQLLQLTRPMQAPTARPTVVRTKTPSPIPTTLKPTAYPTSARPSSASTNHPTPAPTFQLPEIVIDELVRRQIEAIKTSEATAAQIAISNTSALVTEDWTTSDNVKEQQLQLQQQHQHQQQNRSKKKGRGSSRGKFKSKAGDGEEEGPQFTKKGAAHSTPQGRIPPPAPISKVDETKDFNVELNIATLNAFQLHHKDLAVRDGLASPTVQPTVPPTTLATLSTTHNTNGVIAGSMSASTYTAGKDVAAVMIGNNNTNGSSSNATVAIAAITNLSDLVILATARPTIAKCVRSCSKHLRHNSSSSKRTAVKVHNLGPRNRRNRGQPVAFLGNYNAQSAAHRSNVTAAILAKLKRLVLMNPAANVTTANINASSMEEWLLAEAVRQFNTNSSVMSLVRRYKRRMAVTSFEVHHKTMLSPMSMRTNINASSVSFVKISENQSTQNTTRAINLQQQWRQELTKNNTRFRVIAQNYSGNSIRDVGRINGIKHLQVKEKQQTLQQSLGQNQLNLHNSHLTQDSTTRPTARPTAQSTRKPVYQPILRPTATLTRTSESQVYLTRSPSKANNRANAHVDTKTAEIFEDAVSLALLGIESQRKPVEANYEDAASMIFLEAEHKNTAGVATDASSGDTGASKPIKIKVRPKQDPADQSIGLARAAGGKASPGHAAPNRARQRWRQD